ncbi:putative sugar binding protein of ABC transporter [Mesorhizobium delmotii]|uniref:Putative sugar binding protein of ABC transporter n=2 Tax=Mesorhizobium delmotii TaxID=1631247 RepID=A0A2P9AGF6_9HYPH|nr:putative sugar binding protein of ABC transporter [Mesorhizobium delmotii]
MRLLSTIATSIICFSMLSLQAEAETEISVLYPIPSTFSKLQEEIAGKFMEAHPDIKIKFQAPAENYAQAVQQILRSTLTKDTPDVAYIGLDMLRALVERDLPVDLEPFAEADGGFDKLGYMATVVSLGQMNGTTYALPFAISTPILYVNEDLVTAAGSSMDDFPTTWDGILTLGKKIKALPGAPGGFSFQWDSSGNWLVQALINSQGGHMTSENGCEVLFDSKAGTWAFSMLEKFHAEGMEYLTYKQNRPAFDAGKMGIVAGSTAYVAQADTIIGDKFTFRTMPWPDVAKDGRVPTGGASAVILTRDKKKQQAAWEYLKFATGPVGQTLMVSQTGYGPSNRLPVDEPTMLGNYYEGHPNQLTSVNQMAIAQPWESWAGANGIKIKDVINNKVEGLVSGSLKVSDVFPKLTQEVRGLLPTNCPVGN